MGQDKVVKIVGAREHNLKNISLEIPRDKFIVVTGISGSGKSSLAFDTIYAEGNRRYVESLSPYARQFLEQVGKPDVESIEGLPPTISIEKSLGRTNPRSTVATTTEIHDYMRVLFARIGKVHCYKCGREVRTQSAQEIVDRILDFPEGAQIVLLAPLVRGKKGEHRDILTRVRREGFVRVRVNGEMHDVRNVPTLKKTKKYTIEAVVDRLTVSREVRGRIQDSVELALRFGEGMLVVSKRGESGWADTIFSELYACPECGVSFEELSPRMFSFNSPYGACPKCSGMGTTMKLDEDMVIPDQNISIRGGAIHPWHHVGRRFSYRYYEQLGFLKEDFGIDIDVPFKFIPLEKKQVLLYGDDNGLFEGVIPGLMRRFETTTSEHIKKKILEYMSELPCSACKGARLRPESLAVTVGGKNIYRVSLLSTQEALKFFSSLSLTGEEAQIASLVLRELKARLGFMIDVGLYYITLDRQTSTLSSGEAQRIHLATQIGSGLVGVCYCLDEPTVGLHQRDNARLLSSLLRLRDMGNTVIVVEHDEETIRCADHIVDMGPGAGPLGGEVVVAGAISDVTAQPRSITGQYLSGKLSIPLPLARRKLENAEVIEVRGAAENNLKRINVKFPLGGFSCVTGVSGSGKSTLVNQVLFRALQRKLYGSGEKPGKHEKIYGDENIERVVEVSQLPIGRTPRSNPATYSGAFTYIRQLFAMTKDARVRGYTISRFSFNVKGGRCEDCEGQGTKRIEMHFLPDVYVRCETCKGKRYDRETLEVKFKGINIAEVLELRVSEALELFKNYPALHKILKTLYDVGLGYLQLGQPSTTLSGGEAQRIKLAYELAKGSAKSTLYIMDEPTIGLHFADISRLLDVVNRLIESGGSFIVIEHNMDVIKTADYIIDLGPGGGDEGGRVVACGTPEEVAANENSVTGSYLARVMRLPLPRVKSEIA
jgi:excinuclease ABC subunit A